MKYYILLLALCTTTSCSAQSQDKSTILNKALNAPEVKKYFFPELESRNPYYILKNNHLKKDLNLSIHGIPVIIKDKHHIVGENYIEITFFEIDKKKAKLWFYYKIENISVLALFHKEKDKWNVKIKKILQF